MPEATDSDVKPVGIKHAFVTYTTQQLIEFAEATLTEPYLNVPVFYEAEVQSSCDRNGLFLDLPETKQGWAQDLATERENIRRHVSGLKKVFSRASLTVDCPHHARRFWRALPASKSNCTCLHEHVAGGRALTAALTLGNLVPVHDP